MNVKPIKNRDYFIYSIWKVDRKIAESIYNIQLALKLLNKLKDQFHMLMLIGTEKESDKTYLNELLEQYEVVGFVTIYYEKPLQDFLHNGRFLLRTNNVDGYGVSLQEALDLNIPAIASDVCQRPKGTVLFKKDNFADLYEKILHLNEYWNPSETEKPEYHLQLIELYKKHLK